ncbi:fatty acyl-CoA reductase 1-like [Chelonus insularis]|uniref:fatty acyl-CoA reductase 1-like n=1 Tax=Chelonus insularis TaxID=460826 RepID=UPI001589A6A9|nr:fatty acyl-CoA reductase 1-like [Chelonus insularis]
MNKIDPTLSIPAFFAGRSIFITGSTGFMGKILVEKLLRSCPDIREIFLLLRPKKGMSIDDRLRKMISQQPFTKLKEEKPEVFDKLIPVVGDTTKEGLGLPDMERRVLIDRVSIIYHNAASVRFDDSLKAAIFTNTRSARDMCILAAQMKKLVAFVHVSTTYCQADKPVVEEKMYQADVDWKKAIKIVETVDENVLKALTPKFIGNFPNTYTFSKRLAEQVISDYSHVFPCVVFRPSIVISTISEPIRGWLDNFNGPVGMLIGGGKGILRTAFGNAQLIADYIPVDVAIKAMIITTWKRGITTITRDPSIHVYNCSSADMKCISLDDLKSCALVIHEDVPLEGVLWAPRTLYTQSEIVYFINVLLFHLLPALIVDTILIFSNRKPMLTKLQRKVYIANKALAYFLINAWQFNNTNLLKLTTEIPPADRDTFKFEYADMDVREYFKYCLLGAKKFLLNEDIENLEPAKKHLQRMIWIDRAFQVLLALFLMLISYQYGFISYIFHIFDKLMNVFIIS